MASPVAQRRVRDDLLEVSVRVSDRPQDAQEGSGVIEKYGDLWHVLCDVRVVTTNGKVRKDGACVMGRGTANQAVECHPGINFELGTLLRRHGNHCYLLAGGQVVSYPVKHDWREMADIDLIVRSTHELIVLAEIYEWRTVAMPRPGCGNGGLSWARQVRDVIEPLLDDRFEIIEIEEMFVP